MRRIISDHFLPNWHKPIKAPISRDAGRWRAPDADAPGPSSLCARAQGNKEGLLAISASMTSALRRLKATEWKTSWISSIASNAFAR